MVTRHDMDCEVEIPPIVTGLTSKGEDAHEHKFFVAYDEKGQFKGESRTPSVGTFILSWPGRIPRTRRVIDTASVA